MTEPLMHYFVIPIDPVAWQRVKRGRFGQAYVPRETLQFERAVAAHARTSRDCPPKPLVGPVELAVTFWIERPKRIPKERLGWPCVRPDLDNYAKGVKDALNGIVWADDGQVCQMVLAKKYAERGSILIRVVRLPPAEAA